MSDLHNIRLLVDGPRLQRLKAVYSWIRSIEEKRLRMDVEGVTGEDWFG